MKNVQCLLSLTAIAALGFAHSSLALAPAPPATVPPPGYTSVPKVVVPKTTMGCDVALAGYPNRQGYGVMKAFTPAQICNWSKTPDPNKDMAHLPAMELARLSIFVDMTNTALSAAQIKAGARATGDVSGLLNVFAARLTAPNLLRVKAAFGAVDTDRAVAAHAPVSIQAAYFASPAPPIQAESRAAAQSMGLTAGYYVITASPRLDYTLYEIYLDYLTASGEVTTAAALAQTATFASVHLGVAFAFGWKVGGAIYMLMDNYTPGVVISIGEIEAAIVEGVFGGAGDCDSTHCKPR